MKRYINPTTASALAVVKEEDVSGATEALKSPHMSFEASTAQEALLQPMKTLYHAYTKDFPNLHETHEIQGDKTPNESVDMLLCDPPYSVHCQ